MGLIRKQDHNTVKPIRVLFFRNCRGIYNLSGAEVYLLSLFKGFASQECEFFFLCVTDPRQGETPWIRELKSSGFPFEEVHVSTALSTRDFSSLLRWIHRFNADVVHSLDHRSDVIGILAAKLTRTYAVASHFGWTNWNSDFRKGPLYEWADRKALHFSDALIVDSRAILDELKLKSKGPTVSVIPNGLDTNHFDPDHVEKIPKIRFFSDENVLIVGMVARFHPNKGQMELLKVATDLHRTKPYCRFLMVGDRLPGFEDYKTKMSHFISENQLDEIALIQNADHPQMPATIGSMDIFVAPSAIESFSYSLLAAMSMGKPVVTTRVGGSAELISDGEDGLLIPPNDSRALKNAIEMLLEDSERRAELGRNARRTIQEKYSLHTMVERTIGVYRRVLGRT